MTTYTKQIKELCSVCKLNPIDCELKDICYCKKCKLLCCMDCIGLTSINIPYGTCISCYTNDNLCPICKLNLIDCSSEVKHCIKCKLLCCMDCIGLTGCQTSDGICINCYDYKCKVCNINILNKKIHYLDDEEPVNICESCKYSRSFTPLL